MMMISPKDVRIGNYVLYCDAHGNEIVVKVVRIGEGDFVALAHGNLFVQSVLCKPIDLTQEWRDLFEINEPDLRTMKNYQNIKSVHKVQNMYHAITGKELTIKEFEE